MRREKRGRREKKHISRSPKFIQPLIYSLVCLTRAPSECACVPVGRQVSDSAGTFAYSSTHMGAKQAGQTVFIESSSSCSAHGCQSVLTANQKTLVNGASAPFTAAAACGCDDFILCRGDSNGAADDSNRDNDEGDNKVFVPLGWRYLKVVGDARRWPLRWLPLPVVTHALKGEDHLPRVDIFNPDSS